MRQNLPVTGRNLELPKDANILSTTSPQSHITYVNPDFIKISGFTEEELLGQPHNIVDTQICRLLHLSICGVH
ncbi:PAS domain S-box protein [Escherichia coli]|uniref:PAS domain S-box protein n=1 Tax=Escherichia coli TaxID=562 RepID=UPI0020C7B8BB|nr:PAS domain S-box protein [Escherichia coli]MCP8769002.1 PAS domain S-box protein [Escherichia coli]